MRRRGLTIVDAIVLTVLVVLVTMIALVFSSGRRHNGHGRVTKESYQVRGIVHSMIVWADSNRDEFPLPSVIDANSTTVAEVGDAKNTTANILSVLVYNGFLPTEMLVSCVEVNENIRVDEDYETSKPKAAVNPALALWDPALSADFTSAGGGNISYAHIPPVGARRALWSVTNASGTTPIVGHRGPEIAGIAQQAGRQATPSFARPTSNTFQFLGSPKKWEGMVAYGDNHVDFALAPAPYGLTYKSTDGLSKPDLLFYDEPDDADGVNAFLGIFIKAGPEKPDFHAIWD